MYKKLRKKAEKKVQAKMAFYTTTIVFFFVSVVLLMLSFYLPQIGFWLKLPIPLFIMILGVLYITAFGLPTTEEPPSEDWYEEAIEKELVKIYRQKKSQLPPLGELSKEELLELKELEQLKNKWEDNDSEYI